MRTRLGSISSVDGSTDALFEQHDYPSRDDNLSFVVHTSDDGRQGGKLFCLKAETAALCGEWVGHLRTGWQNAIQAARQKDPAIERLRYHVRAVFNSRPVAMLRFLVILAAFTASVVAEELKNPDDNSHGPIIESLQFSFTVFFCLELMVNAFAHWRDEFLADRWNWFDTIIVSLSILSEFVDHARTVQVVRLLRCIRVIRLFRLFRALNNIATALAASLWPVFNTFVVLLIVSCIYAVRSPSCARMQACRASGAAVLWKDWVLIRADDR